MRSRVRSSEGILRGPAAASRQSGLLGGGVPGLDPLGQLHLELPGEQRDLADLLQIRVDGVGGGATTVVGRRVRGDAAPAGPRRLAVHDLVDRLALEGAAFQPLQRAVALVTGRRHLRPARWRASTTARLAGKSFDDFFGHHFGDRFGDGFFEHHRCRAVARLLDVLDALFAHAQHDVLDDVVGELHRLEHEDEVVLGQVAAPTTDGEQRLEPFDRHTFGRWTDGSGRLVNLTHSCRPFQ